MLTVSDRDGNIRDGNIRDGNIRDGNIRDGKKQKPSGVEPEGFCRYNGLRRLSWLKNYMLNFG